MQALQQGSPAKGLLDADIVQQVLAGDTAAFESLMRRYNRALYRTARSIVKDDAEAEDALQDAYLLAFQALHKFRGESSLSTWLTRIVINESIARSRKTARRAEIFELGASHAEHEQRAEVRMSESTTERPEQAAMRAQARQLLEKKIDALPDSFRTVFVLRALEEMTVEETAACLDIPEATVRSRYFRARGMLREALALEVDYAFDSAFAFDGERCDRIVARTYARLRQAQDIPAASGEDPLQEHQAAPQSPSQVKAKPGAGKSS